MAPFDKKKMAVQRRWMANPDNRWFTGEAVGHNPTDGEAAMHFITHGGAKIFADWWNSLTEQQREEEYQKIVPTQIAS